MSALHGSACRIDVEQIGEYPRQGGQPSGQAPSVADLLSNVLSAPKSNGNRGIGSSADADQTCQYAVRVGGQATIAKLVRDLSGPSHLCSSRTRDPQKAVGDRGVDQRPREKEGCGLISVRIALRYRSGALCARTGGGQGSP